MHISLKPAFLATYQLLDEYFDNNPNEKLGMLLSDMNPYLFTDSDSADPATYNEWEYYAKTAAQGKNLTENSIFQALISFLNHNEEQYGYQTETVVKDIQSPSYQNRWQHILEKASIITDM